MDVVLSKGLNLTWCLAKVAKWPWEPRKGPRAGGECFAPHYDHTEIWSQHERPIDTQTQYKRGLPQVSQLKEMDANGQTTNKNNNITLQPERLLRSKLRCGLLLFTLVREHKLLAPRRPLSDVERLQTPSTIMLQVSQSKSQDPWREMSWAFESTVCDTLN